MKTRLSWLATKKYKRQIRRIVHWVTGKIVCLCDCCNGTHIVSLSCVTYRAETFLWQFHCMFTLTCLNKCHLLFNHFSYFFWLESSETAVSFSSRILTSGTFLLQTITPDFDTFWNGCNKVSIIASLMQWLCNFPQYNIWWWSVTFSGTLCYPSIPLLRQCHGVGSHLLPVVCWKIIFNSEIGIVIMNVLIKKQNPSHSQQNVLSTFMV